MSNKLTLAVAQTTMFSILKPVKRSEVRKVNGFEPKEL